MTHALLDTRRTQQPVRRDSFDINDGRARVFRPIEHGIAFVDHYLEVLEEWSDLIKRKGQQHELSANCRKVLATLMKRCLDFKTGTCEPSLDTLAEKTRLAKPTIVRALKLLNLHGFIDWVRRTEKTGNRPGHGPQVKQVSNAYYFDAARLPERCFKRLQEKLKRKGKAFQPAKYATGLYQGLRERREARRACRQATFRNATPLEQAKMLHPNDEAAQRIYLEMVASSKGAGASSAAVLNPPSNNQRE